jgi:hypothetical protein
MKLNPSGYNTSLIIKLFDFISLPLGAFNSMLNAPNGNEQSGKIP